MVKRLKPDRIHLSLEVEAAQQDIRQVEKGLADYNRQFAPDDSYQPLNIFLRDMDNAVWGGLLGNTYWGWLYIRILWIDESLRGQGCGSQLIRAAEDEAIRRGCRHAHLDTMSFQARPFYEKLGYKVFGELSGLPTSHSRIFLMKELIQPGD